MEKKKIEVHAVTIHIYTVIIAVLVVLLAFVGLKYLHLKFAVHEFTQGAIMMNSNQRPMGSVSDYAMIIGTTVASYPQTVPLYTQPAALQNYVTTLSKELHRDIVVLDTSRKVLADTVAANVGTNYSYDTNHEIDQALKDGQPRSFTEKSVDYKDGLSELVVPMKDANNKVIGAVIVSNTTVK